MADPRSISPQELARALESNRPFEDVIFSADLDVDARDLSERTFARCRFEIPVVRDTDFSSAEFKDCTFLPTRFASCKFTEARMEKCTLFSSEKKAGCTFAFCEMRALELDHCNLASCSFERCDLYNLRATETNFRSCKFKGSDFHRQISRSVVLTKARFDACNLSFADMSALSLKSCEFPACKFSETLFFDSDLTETVLENAIIDRAEWDRARLSNADLRGASITGINLATLADYSGLMISESQQESILEALGIRVWPG
jgi:fluoroquinolone resistance protein